LGRTEQAHPEPISKQGDVRTTVDLFTK
jgi:hypothetical protein